MRTKKAADEFFFNVTASTGFVQNVAFQDGLHMGGGDTDWLGVDDGWRDKSPELQAATANNQELRKYSPFSGVGIPQEQLDEVGRSFNNQYTPEIKELPPNASFTISSGNYFDIADTGAKVNYLAAVNYSNSWDTDIVERNSWVPGTKGLMHFDGMTWMGTEHSVDTSGIFTTGIDFNFNHNIRLTSVLLRKTDNLVGRATGFVEDSLDVELNESRWIERELVSNQLQGDHFFPDLHELTINWRVSTIAAARDAPDERIYRRDNDEFSSRVDGNLRNWSTLDDKVNDFGLDLSMVFYNGPAGSIITPRIGFMHVDKKRQSEIRRFGFAFAGAKANDVSLLLKPLEEILVPENIVQNGFTIREITRPTDNYQAENEMDAFYGEVEVNFDDRFRFTVGGRQENFRQLVDTFDLFRPGVGSRASQDSNNLLPALSLTYTLGEHQFRFGYSQTVSRPDFRELSPAAFTNPLNGRDIIGNPDLKITELENFDLRWEWYFGYSDYASIGLFYKEFENPIEASIIGSTQRAGTYINAEAAENSGIEMEFYKRLDFLGTDFLNGLGDDIYIQANASLIDSDVTIAEKDLGVLTSSSRPLQGQSEYLFNLQIGYEPIDGTTATLLYHRYERESLRLVLKQRRI